MQAPSFTTLQQSKSESHSHVMSSLMEVDTGMLRLLLTAWQVKTASKSALLTFSSLRPLAVAPSLSTS